MFWWRGCAIYAGKDDLVVEGRDIGSVVFSATPYKFYNRRVAGSASAAARGARARDEIARRDQADSSRSASPYRRERRGSHRHVRI